MIHFYSHSISQLMKFLQTVFCIFILIRIKIEFFQYVSSKINTVSKSIYLLLGNSIHIFSSQKSSGQSTPSYNSKFVLLQQHSVFNLYFFSFKHVILNLSSDWLMQIVLFAYLKGIENILSIPITCCPIKSVVFLYYLMKSSTYFLKRCLRIKSVSIDNINIVHLQSFQTFRDALFDMFSVCT